MNSHHKEILQMIENSAKVDTGHFDLPKYLGTTRKLYHLNTATRVKILREWKAQNKDLTFDEYKEVIISLNKADSFDEKIFSSSIIGFFPQFQVQLKPQFLDQLLDNLNGWAEIDNLCQSTFSAKELLANWSDWESTLLKFNENENISKRRASLVLLVKPVREMKDDRLYKTAFHNIDNLKHEKDILITKAISWLLRSLIKHHKDMVAQYLDANQDKLPKIALRETRRKLETGKK